MTDKFIIVGDGDVHAVGNTADEAIKAFNDEEFDEGDYFLYELKKRFQTVNVLREVK